jgi:hypothetical protein
MARNNATLSGPAETARSTCESRQSLLGQASFTRPSNACFRDSLMAEPAQARLKTTNGRDSSLDEQDDDEVRLA